MNLNKIGVLIYSIGGSKKGSKGLTKDKAVRLAHSVSSEIKVLIDQGINESLIAEELHDKYYDLLTKKEDVNQIWDVQSRCTDKRGKLDFSYKKY